MQADAPPAETLRPDEQALVQYAPISKAALGALALGLASPLILVTPLLLLVPLAGIAVAAVALRRIATSEGQLSGYWPATIGLCLATLFLGWGASYQLTRQAALADQAERMADGWLRLVAEGKLQEADQLMQAGSDRARTKEEMMERYKSDREVNENLQAFFSREPMKSFRAAGPQVEFAASRVAAVSRHGELDEIVLEYRYSAAGEAPRTMFVSVQRTARGERPADWQLRGADESLPQ